jgi:hypothetical protein
VGKSTLGRVLDPSELDACTGPRARLRVHIPGAWLADGVDLAVTTPARLACASCDGGGCDTCGRSGAVRAPADTSARLVRTRLPPAQGRPAIMLRIAHPFGPEHDIRQLLLEVVGAEAASPGVVRVASPGDREGGGRSRAIPVPVLVIAVVAALLYAVLGRP